eukprot:gnl/Dysnectes_brevis/109_a130_11433.p1 GENE.gnl/Dysnectes_brevis/109_a130_11433~~gnl/Dysnectes_brevis/109_a130_11433.p1  ORF type:complete len:144 (+),score=31.29 gnl/Dysnectes_brevis/109_a130_11433:33-464(+)
MASKGVCLKDVPAELFVDAFAAQLKSEGAFKQPAYTEYAKTGACRDRVPESDDWYFVRAAAVLRRLYVRRNVGVGAFTKVFGTAYTTKCAPQHFKRSSSKVIRNILQQYEALGYVTQPRNGSGRVMTRKGQKIVDQFSKSLVE